MSENGHAALRVQGKTAVVTGASRGMGRAIALSLAREGANLVLVGRSREDLGQTRSDCVAQGVGAVCVEADISEGGAGERIGAETQRAFGGVDILVNNAGISPVVCRAEVISESDWHAVLKVNLLGTFFVTQAIGRIMLAHGRGSIVNVTSIGAKTALFGLSAYCATKAALDELTRCLAYEWTGRGVRVNAIAPGFVQTDMTTGLEKTKGRFYQQAIEKPLLRRFAEPSEIAGAVLFLASDEASYVTGQTLFIDGGWTIW